MNGYIIIHQYHGENWYYGGCRDINDASVYTNTEAYELKQKLVDEATRVVEKYKNSTDIFEVDLFEKSEELLRTIRVVPVKITIEEVDD